MKQLVAALLLCFLASCSDPTRDVRACDEKGYCYNLRHSNGNIYYAYKIPKQQNEPTKRN